MNEQQQQELNERIANANADGDERQIYELSRVYLALIEAHGLNIEAARNVIDRALKQAAAALEIFGSAEAAARFEGNDTSARAKAAEAEATRLRDENAEAWFAFDRQQSRGDRLAARVAELESQLAAQGWRPVTEDWPPYGVQHLGRAMLNSPTLLVTRTTDDSDEVWQDNDGMLFYGDEIRYCAVIPESPPLPPAPQERTR